MNEYTDQFAVSQLIVAERYWRDTKQWDQMRSAYHPDSFVRVAWFQGSGFDFVEASRQSPHQQSLSKHRLSPSRLRLNGDRAIAETDMRIEIRFFSGTCEIDLVVSCRLFNRVRRDEGIWRLASLDVIYEKDSCSPVNPAKQVQVDWEKLLEYRPSYRFLCYYNQHRFVDPDLPGDDRSELVARLYAEADAWLQDARA